MAREVIGDKFPPPTPGFRNVPNVPNVPGRINTRFLNFAKRAGRGFGTVWKVDLDSYLPAFTFGTVRNFGPPKTGQILVKPR